MKKSLFAQTFDMLVEANVTEEMSPDDLAKAIAEAANHAYKAEKAAEEKPKKP